jgi:iron complex outermembrane receptor protein
MLNEPISATFALRAAASFNIHDGFLNPVLGNYRPTDRPRRRQDQDDATGRVSGLWSIGDGGSLLLTGTFGQVEGVGANYTALLDSVLTRHGSAAREVYYNPMGGSVDDHFRNVNAELKLDLGHLQLTYVGARMRYQARDQDRVSGNDPAANGGGNYNWRNYIGDYTTDSHELRLSNAEAQRMEWVAGYNYNNEFIEEHDQSWTTPITNPVLSSSANNVAIIANTVHGSDGIFGQINFHATDALRLTLGIRRSSDRVRRRGTIAAGPGPWIDSRGNSPCVALNDCIGAPDNGDQSAAKFTYRVGSDYQITGNQMLYASVATGYKAGGFNDYEPTSGRVASYEPEQLTAYEAGYKGRLLPNLQFDSAAYYYDYSKNQVTQVVGIFNLSPPVIVIYTKTVPTVFYGWESELHFKMTARDFIDLEIALERNYYKHLQAGFNYLAQTDWSGYRLDNTPTAAATLAYSHRWLPESGGYWEAHVSSKYSSGYLLSDFQQPRQYVQAPFTRSDFTLTYGSDSGKVEVQVYARNIEDRLQLLSPPQNVVPAVVNAANVGVSEPRTVGVRIGIRY